RDAERLAAGRAVPAAAGDAEKLRAEAAELSAQARVAVEAERTAAERAEAASRALAEAGPTGSVDVVVLERLVSQAARLERALTVDTAQIEEVVRRRVEADSVRTAELGATLRQLGAEEVGLRGLLTASAERASALEVELARIDAERDEARRRLEAAGDEPAEG